MPGTYDAAKRYVSVLGWALVPIPPGTKGPNQPGWNLPENLVSTEEACEFWKKKPQYNVGVQLEESGIVALDIDNVEYTELLFAEFGLDYETVLDGAPRTVGKPGHDKAFFRAPDNEQLKTHKLSWPNKDNPKKTETVIEFRAGPVQDVLPPSVHPDTKEEYTWRVAPVNIPALPAPILEIWMNWDRYKSQLRNACPWAKKQMPPPAPKPRRAKKEEKGVIQKYNEKNDVEQILSRHGYIRASNNRYLSPYSESGLPGVIIFPEGRVYSHHASEPFDTDHSLDAFDLFCELEHNGNLRSALRAAHLEFDAPPSVVEIDLKPTAAPKKERPELPDYLVQVPGILSEVVDYYNSTAPKEQPQFAVTAALAVGSVFMGRRFVSDQNNFSSLYFVNVGKSSAGKEHAKTVIEAVLGECGAEHLIGPAGYTSGGGVLSALIDQPCHVSIIDELGKVLESSTKSKNANKMDAQTMLMEAFGRLDGTLRAQGYSTMTMTDKQKESLGIKRVVHPALTVMSMTTPETLYRSISVAAITSGFIPRFIIVESSTGRQVSRRRGRAPRLSEKLKKWAHGCITAHADDGNLSEGFGPETPPSPILIPFEEDALDLLDEYEAQLIKRQNALDTFGIAPLLGRTREIAHRVALIVAISNQHSCIYIEDVKYAIQFVDYYADQTVEKVKSRVAGSDFEQICKEVLDLIKNGGDRGATHYEIVHGCALYRAAEPRVRDAVMSVLPEDYDVGFATIQNPAGGRPRQAYIQKTSEN
jgi:hypothetical protein